jgi:nucleoside-diphosphate-sugar epimerase
MKTNTSSSELQVVLGAGQIGSRLSKLLVARGHRVRLVQRSQPSVHLAGVEHHGGDIREQSFSAQVTHGASVVYDCMNPAYHQWSELLLPIAQGALFGAQQAQAKLVALDCLYMYGRPKGNMDENTPLEPCSKKGELRVQLHHLRMGAHQRGDVRVTLGRASDFFGANLPYSSWNDRFFQRIFAGKAGECMGDPDMPHSYTYVEDIAQALVTLGEQEQADGQVWHLPTNTAESTQSLAKRLGTALGINARVQRLHPAMLYAAGIFSPFMREVREMAYQWEVPFVMDDSKFRKAFNQFPTPINQAVAETATWANNHYRPQMTAMLQPS